MRAVITWIVLVGLGTATMLAIQLAGRGLNPVIVAPFSQAAGMLVAWALAWPLWYRYQPKHLGFALHTASMLVVVVLLAAIRIEFRLG